MKRKNKKERKVPSFNKDALIRLRTELEDSQAGFIFRLEQYTNGRVSISSESLRNYERGRSEPAGYVMHAIIHLAKNEGLERLSKMFYSWD